MPSRLILIGLALPVLFAASCSGCGLDLSGTKCAVSSECGGTMLCDPTTHTCLEPDKLPGLDAAGAPADAALGVDAAPAGLDASVEQDAATAGLDAAEPGLDAAPAGLDAAPAGADAHNPLISPPTRECANPSDWCAAQLPARDGGWPQMTGVTGTSDRDIWISGKGPTVAHWDGHQWEDQSAGVILGGADAGLPITEINTISSSAAYFLYAGTNGGTASACGWKNTQYPESDFYDQSYCSGGAGYAWQGSCQLGQDYILVGEKGHIYSTSIFTDVVANDYRAVHLQSNRETWIAGSAGSVRYMSLGDAQSMDATQAIVGFPQINKEFRAVYATSASLFVGGKEALYECDRSGALGFPALSHCENKLSLRQTIHAFAATSRTDLWAVGVDENSGAKPILLHRTALNTWENIPPPIAVGGLYSVWRYPWLLVVVGDNGAVFSKVVP